MVADCWSSTWAGPLPVAGEGFFGVYVDIKFPAVIPDIDERKATLVFFLLQTLLLGSAIPNLNSLIESPNQAIVYDTFLLSSYDMLLYNMCFVFVVRTGVASIPLLSRSQHQPAV